MLENLFGHKQTPSFSRKREWNKLKDNIGNMHWRVPHAADIEKNNKKADGDDSLKVTLVGSTGSKEISGIIENKLRIFGLDSPKHFNCHHYFDDHKDEYAFHFTDCGVKTLAKKGIKLDIPAS